MPKDDYTPIACALHDEYEIAIMHKAPMRLRWRDASGTWRHGTVLPLDLVVANGEEFLRFRREDGQEEQIRLDRLSPEPA